ncbi:hypothetical protein PPGU19_094950 (plasmid) [Paraburkholderia sp. PGU19]|uniref:nuclear transport factor 2 family protein n=1 Tax=Paraburkholderia sp. PGU19 TaxID=2735434 RepID=UPI0015DAFECF|nr:nuclear transport factor 2 family protein [Paraburkholderia sp. PGU19]BCG04927.1 hypothetical protein PPGU19_094950 [Paraburkholderia sp. PGU19]
MNVEDRLAIQELSHRYAYFVDCFDIDNWVSVFTPAAILDETELGTGLLEGHEAIRRYGREIVDTTQHVVHLMSNHIIWSLEGDAARGTVFSLVDAISKSGERTRYQIKYEDEYLKVSGSWKIARRKVRPTLPPEAVGA